MFNRQAKEWGTKLEKSTEEIIRECPPQLQRQCSIVVSALENLLDIINDVNCKVLGRYVNLNQLKGEIVSVGYKTVRQVLSNDLEFLLVE